MIDGRFLTLLAAPRPRRRAPRLPGGRRRPWLRGPARRPGTTGSSPSTTRARPVGPSTRASLPGYTKSQVERLPSGLRVALVAEGGLPGDVATTGAEHGVPVALPVGTVTWPAGARVSAATADPLWDGAEVRVEWMVTLSPHGSCGAVVEAVPRLTHRCGATALLVELSRATVRRARRGRWCSTWRPGTRRRRRCRCSSGADPAARRASSSGCAPDVADEAQTGRGEPARGRGRLPEVRRAAVPGPLVHGLRRRVPRRAGRRLDRALGRRRRGPQVRVRRVRRVDALGPGDLGAQVRLLRQREGRGARRRLRRRRVRARARPGRLSRGTTRRRCSAARAAARR